MQYTVQYSTLHFCNHCTCGQFVVLVHLLQPVIARYELAKERITARKKIDGASHGDGRYIYNSKKNYDFMDFAVDEHGLWLIYNHQSMYAARIRKSRPISRRNYMFQHQEDKIHLAGRTVLPEH